MSTLIATLQIKYLCYPSISCYYMGVPHGLTMGVPHGLTMGVPHGLTMGVPHGLTMGVPYSFTIWGFHCT